MDKDSRNENVLELHALDFDEDFALIDAAICEYDAVGNAPQRKGESSFQWSSIETSCLGLLARAKDIRVAIWYMRACMARRGMAGLAEGINVLADIMSSPVDEIHPRPCQGSLPERFIPCTCAGYQSRNFCISSAMRVLERQVSRSMRLSAEKAVRFTMIRSSRRRRLTC